MHLGTPLRVRTIFLQRQCSSDINKWACVSRRLKRCYVPNSAGVTCAIMPPSTKYRAAFRTCGCADDPRMEPCTVSEVQLLAYNWMPDFQEHFEKKGGLILLRNMKVMDDTGSVSTDFNMKDDSACELTAKYTGIFCRGNDANVLTTA